MVKYNTRLTVGCGRFVRNGVICVAEGRYLLTNIPIPVFHRKETNGSAAFPDDTGESGIPIVRGSTRPNLQDTHP